MFRTEKNIYLILLAILSMATPVTCMQQRSTEPDSDPHVRIQEESYSKARQGFRTKLVRVARSPQPSEPIRTPAGVNEIQYQSGSLKLNAWLNQPANRSKRYPAVLFLHGGFAFSGEDWQMCEPYRDAGFIVMSPTLRGENGQRGTFTMYYDEVGDVVAAAEYLRTLPYVDPNQIFVAGHSAGGTMALLAALTSRDFRAAASFSGSPDQVNFFNYTPEMNDWAPFDSTNIRDLEMRSPLAFAQHFTCPLRIYYGVSEPHWFQLTSQRTAAIAQQNHVNAEAVEIGGDYDTSVPESMRRSIEFFRQIATTN